MIELNVNRRASGLEWIANPGPIMSSIDIAGFSRRRLMLAGIGLLAVPRQGLAAFTGPRVVGVMDQWMSTRPTTPPRMTVDELAKLGHRAPRVRYEWRHSAGSAMLLERFALELVSMNLDVILSFGGIASRAVCRATSAIPIVAWLGDPVAEGLASTSLTPLRNVTGFADHGIERVYKALELLKSLLPTMKRFGLLEPAENHAAAELNAALRGFAAVRNLELITVQFRTRRDLVRGMALLQGKGVKAALAWPSPGLMRATEVSRLAVEHGIALVAEGAGARYGQLLTFSPEIPAARMARQVDKILRGVPVASIPFELPEKYVLHMNRKTAAALGVSIPPHIRLAVDHFYDDWDEAGSP